MEDRFLKVQAVMNITGLGRTTIGVYEKAGRFPGRRQVGPGRVAWLESEVRAWMESRKKVAERSGNGADRKAL